MTTKNILRREFDEFVKELGHDFAEFERKAAGE